MREAVVGMGWASPSSVWCSTGSYSVRCRRLHQGSQSGRGLPRRLGRGSPSVALYFLIALVLVAVIAFNFRRGGDISIPYVQSLRLIAKNSVLWVMFLASMAASVFFSFDSHFNAIFPPSRESARPRSAPLNQVGRVVADIGERTQKAQIAEAERLFDTDGWKAYDAAAGQAGARGAGLAGRDREVLRPEDGGSPPRHHRAAGAHRRRGARPDRPADASAMSSRPSCSASSRAPARWRPNMAKAQGDLRRDQAGNRGQAHRASAEDGGVEGTMKRGKGPSIASA